MPTADYRIQDVWHSNLEEEFRKIRYVVNRYPYVAMVSGLIFDDCCHDNFSARALNVWKLDEMLNLMNLCRLRAKLHDCGYI